MIEVLNEHPCAELDTLAFWKSCRSRLAATGRYRSLPLRNRRTVEFRPQPVMGRFGMYASKRRFERQKNVKVITPRSITIREAEVLDLALKRGALVPVPDFVLADVPSLKVVGICT